MLWHNTLWGFMLIDAIQPSSLVTNAISPTSATPNTSLMVWPFQQFPILQAFCASLLQFIQCSLKT